MGRRAAGGARAPAVPFALARPSSRSPAGPRPAAARRELLGGSVRGRAIRVWERGVPSTTTVLVIGCVHGDECAGVKIAALLLEGEPASFVDLWVVRNLNPDGRAAGARGDGHGAGPEPQFP